ncbi:MAG: YbhB/YbcL family Raf kinase inhibitor-like protein [Phycisphaerales bacterium]
MKSLFMVLGMMLAAAVGWRVMLAAIGAGQAVGGHDMKLTSKAFTEGQAIPKRYSGEGEDVSPPLSWSGLPAGTKSLALIVDDPDAPRDEPWVHWVAYNIPIDVTELPEGLPKKLVLDSPKLVQGRNSWPGENVGYRGPMPPPGGGVHHYHFHLYALDGMLDLRPGADKAAVLRQMRGHVVGECGLVGTYQR